MQGEILRKKYEAFILFVLFYAALGSWHCCGCISLDPYSTYMVAPFILCAVTFSFLLLPPREHITLFAVAFEISLANLGLVLCDVPNYCRFDAVFIVTVSYLACHLLLSMIMAVRGLSLEDMGLMGLITRGIWAGFKILVYGEDTLPPEHDVCDSPTDLKQSYSAQGVPRGVHESGLHAALGGSLEPAEKLA